MPFTFKLSKRLALSKALLAFGAVLASACDRRDPTAPPAFISSLSTTAALVPTVVASADDGNGPQNTLDNDLGTRWSVDGDGQWIRYDLGMSAAIDRVDIAWYRGDARIASFDIDVSPDAVTWTRVFSGQSSGKTLQLEPYTFAATSGRYVRIVGHGNTANTWTSITEVAMTALPKLSVAAVAASSDDGNIPQNTLDNDLGTRWSADGDGQWIRYDLGGTVTTGHVDIAWHLGDARVAYFDIEVSPDAVSWTRVFSGQSSGKTLQLESYAFAPTSGRYVRIVGHGNSTNTWTSSTEVAFPGAAKSAPTPTSLPAASVHASGDDGNGPQNTVDNSLATRWSANGDGPWIRYDLGALANITRVDIAWYLGDTRVAYFDIDVSLDAITWTRVFSGQSSGKTIELEPHAVSTASGRYVRITGHGNSATTWNSVAEVDVYGTVSSAPPPDATGEPVSLHIGSPNLEPGLVGRTDLVLFEDFELSDWLKHWSGGYVVDPASLSPVTTPLFQGTRALEVRVPSGSHYGVDLDFAFAKKGLPEPDAIYLRYYVRFNDSWQINGDGQLGKFPGFGGTYNRCGWGSGIPDGTCWSARMVSYDVATGNRIGFYTYHLDQGSIYGDILLWQPTLARGQWYCVEAYVQLNSVSSGTANYDGVLRGWIDGAAAYQRTNMRFRDVTTNHIEKIWWNVYIGGTWTADRNMAIHFDNVVVAKQRIGC